MRITLLGINAQRPAVLEGLHETVFSTNQLGGNHCLFGNVVNEYYSLGSRFLEMLKGLVLQRKRTYMRAAHQRCCNLLRNKYWRKEKKKKRLSQKHLWNDHDLLYQQVLVSNLPASPFKIDHIAGYDCNNLKNMWLHWLWTLQTRAKPTKEKWPCLSSLCSSWSMSEGTTPSWVIMFLLPWGIPTSILMEETVLHGGTSSLSSG